MDDAGLSALIDELYSPAFDLARAKAELGDGTPPEELRPFQLKLAARDPLASVVWLETVEPVPPSSEPFLTGVRLDFKEPVPISFAPLAERFGPAVEKPRLKPHDPIPFQFQVNGTPLQGYLLLAIVPGSKQEDPRQVLRITLRRFPPGSMSPAA